AGLPKIPGSTRLMDLSLFLLEDGSYAAVYRELDPIDSTRSAEVSKKILRGRWSVANDQLVVDGLGTGAGVAYNGRDAVMFRVAANNGDIQLAYVGSSASMEVQTRQ